MVEMRGLMLEAATQTGEEVIGIDRYLEFFVASILTVCDELLENLSAFGSDQV